MGFREGVRVYIYIYAICPLQIQLESHIFVDLHENKTYKVLGLSVVTTANHHF